jgi:two-component system, chemotaxis family, chemotaxis protein CheY
MAKKRVLSVGQCGADHAAIAGTIERSWDAEVIAADTANDAFNELRQNGFAVVLVNRVLDADGTLGVNLIRQLKNDERFRDVPVMLVSNYDDAQQEATEAGAVSGFGKSALGQPHMLARVTPYLE